MTSSNFNTYGDAVDAYRSAGWPAVFPLPSGQKSPPPSGVTGRKAAWPNDAQHDGWAVSHALSNIGVRMPDGVLGIDVDAYDAKHGADSFAALEAKHGELPATWISTSRDDGVSGIRFFRVDADTEWSEAKAGASIELIHSGHRYSVVAPSTHPSGRKYHWVTPDGIVADAGVVPVVSELPTLPDSWAEALCKQTVSVAVPAVAADTRPMSTGHAYAALTRAVGTITSATDRNNQLNSSAYHMGQIVAGGAIDVDTVRTALRKAAVDAGLDDAEISKTLESGLRSGMSEPKTNGEVELPCTDVGNGERIARSHAGQILYVGGWGKWLLWNGRSWEVDNTGTVARIAKQTSKNIIAEAHAASDDNRRAALLKWAYKSMDDNRQKAMINQASTEFSLSESVDAFDVDPYIMNVRNGVLDLKTGELLPHDANRRVIKMANVDFDADAECPKFERFLNRIFNNDAELISYVQRMLGYAMTGSTAEQAMFVFHGGGANGKSQLIDVVMSLLGDYARVGDPSLLVDKKFESHPAGVADLQGARLVTCVETDENKYLAEGPFKMFTGSDRLKARFMGKDFFEFTPTHTLILATNHLPRTRGTDHGLWRRIRVVPFNVTISDSEKVPNLGAKLIAEEASGILNWLVKGVVDWFCNGESVGAPPESVTAATTEYRNDQNVFGKFINEMYVSDPDSYVLIADVHLAHMSWAMRSGEPEIERKYIKASALKVGLGNKRVTKGVAITGIRARLEGE